MVGQVNPVENLWGREQVPNGPCITDRSLAQFASDIDRWRAVRHQPIACVSCFIRRSLAQRASFAVRWHGLRHCRSMARFTSAVDRGRIVRHWPSVGAAHITGRSAAQRASPPKHSSRDPRQPTIKHGPARVTSLFLTRDAKIEHARLLRCSASPDGDSPRLQMNRREPWVCLNKKRTAT